MVHGGIDDVRRQSGMPRQLTSAADPGADGGQDEVQRLGPGLTRQGHPTSLAIWKTTTESTQATANCMPTPNAAHRTPISRFWAARVATQGV